PIDGSDTPISHFWIVVYDLYPSCRAISSCDKPYFFLKNLMFPAKHIVTTPPAMLFSVGSSHPIRWAGVVCSAFASGSNTVVGKFSISLFSYLYTVALFFPNLSAN